MFHCWRNPFLIIEFMLQTRNFSSVQQHICTRLTSPLKAIGSDPIYICHCYNIMASLAASCNNTRLFINSGLTVSEDNHVNLVVKVSGFFLY